MRRLFVSLLIALGCCQSTLYANSQALSVSVDQAGVVDISWDGVSDRTYFIQYSTDLVNWSFFPVIESGAGTELEWSFTSNYSELFVRLMYTDTVIVVSPLVDDFDGDGMSNEDEITSTSWNPFELDSDNDGTPDNEEDSDGDGYTDGEELNNLLSDPNDPDDLDGVTDDNPEAAPPGSHQLVVIGDLAEGIAKTENNPIALPILGPQKYLLVVAIDSDEFPEWTRDQSEFNDTISWKFFVDGLEEISGSAAVNDLHQDWLDGIFIGREFRGYKPVSFQEVSIFEIDLRCNRFLDRLLLS